MTRRKDGLGKSKGETRKYTRQYTKCRKHAECRSRPGNIWYKEPKK